MLLATAAGEPAARDVAGLYAAEVAVADRSAKELGRGASAALAKVLVKLTGSSAAATDKVSAGLRGRAAELLLKYAYASPSDDAGLRLAAEFDAPALTAELTRLGVPVWGKERPETVVWLVVDRPAGRELVGGDEPGELGGLVVERAAQRGIPVLLPLMDIEASQHLGFAGDFSGLASAANALSARYGTTATLVGYLREDNIGLWEVNWQLTVGTETYAWQQAGDIVDLLVEEGVDTLADALARRFANPAVLAAAADLSVTITGVASAEDYARVVNYLDGLDTVTESFVRAVDNRRLLVELGTRGGREAFESSIGFGRVLAPVPGQPDVYRFSP
ncbi:MAG: DUF2066 domain-containing protein [Gammaproteobacteria bacterium]